MLSLVSLLLVAVTGVSAQQTDWSVINEQLGNILFSGLEEQSSSRICDPSCLRGCSDYYGEGREDSVIECWTGSILTTSGGEDGVQNCGCDYE